jgi:Arylsulfotransferase (ASST)
VLAGTSAASAAGLGASGCKDIAGSRAGGPPASRTSVRLAQEGFVSRPDLTPPPITVRRLGHVGDSRYVFLDAPNSGPGRGGTMILDSGGDLVWLGPDTATHHKLDFDVQVLDGEPVLTWWQGEVVQGYGQGEAVIADSSYRVRHVIRARNGLMADLHEFNITPEGTALITAYRRHANADLRERGGPANGYLLSGVAQEIDIATGELLFEWDSYRPAHAAVPVGETYERVGDGYGTSARPFDYFHINSIAPDADGDLLISSRNTWTVYKVSKKNGSIVWRMGGKKSDFSFGLRSRFFWQHHVRTHGHGKLTVFDNGNSARDMHSRALILHVDTATMHVRLRRAYVHPGTVVFAATAGSAQTLPDGGMFVGWGAQPRFSQFFPDGRLLLDGMMASGASSYRAFAREWNGHPTERPAAAARRGGDGAIIYASWNGATDVASWTVFAGRSEGSLSTVGSGRRSGFETPIGVRSTGPYFAAQANDAFGRPLATSLPVMIA